MSELHEIELPMRGPSSGSFALAWNVMLAPSWNEAPFAGERIVAEGFSFMRIVIVCEPWAPPRSVAVKVIW